MLLSISRWCVCACRCIGVCACVQCVSAASVLVDVNVVCKLTSFSHTRRLPLHSDSFTDHVRTTTYHYVPLRTTTTSCSYLDARATWRTNATTLSNARRITLYTASWAVTLATCKLALNTPKRHHRVTQTSVSPYTLAVQEQRFTDHSH